MLCHPLLRVAILWPPEGNSVHGMLHAKPLLHRQQARTCGCGLTYHSDGRSDTHTVAVPMPAAVTHYNMFML